MSRKVTVNLNDNRVEKRYATWIKMVIDLIKPKNLFLIAGRATSKTSDILAERFIDVCEDMPGSYFCVISDTYVNALKNILPALIEGLNRKGWIEGIHYVVDEKPPEHFDDPYKAPQSYKHTISIFNGCFCNLISMDQPSGGAGNSYQHGFGDETKYIDFEKVKKIFPAMRGWKKHASSPFYKGLTFTTDMPNPTEGEYDWILDREKDMNVGQIKLCLQAGFIINDIKIELLNEEKTGDKKKVAQLEKQLARWEARWRKARKNSTFFKIVSSYVNVDFLTPSYFKDSLENLGQEEFATAIGSFPPEVKKGDRFYINFAPHHILDDGINTDYYLENYEIGDERDESSLALKYIDHNKPIDIGVDFGIMCSLVSGQINYNTAYLFKEFFTLPPDHLKQLAIQFDDYYKNHGCKIINFYYDRSGNAYQQVGKDFGSELAGYLAELGWSVEMMSKGQSTILQSEEFALMKNIMEGSDGNLPRFKICKFGCRNTISSLQKAKTKNFTDRKGVKQILKDKTFERSRDYKRLPAESTNLSDAVKYFFFRKSWADASAKRRKSSGFVDKPEVL